MRIDWWTLALQTINALVLIFLLSRFLFKPIAAIIAERQAAAERLLSEAFEARIGAEGERDLAERALAETAADRAAAVEKALAEASKEKAALIATARAEIEKLRAAARAEIASERKAAEAAAAERAGVLAVEIAQKLVDRLPEDARVSGFIEGLAGALAKLPPETRARFGANGQPVRLAAPRPLSQAEQAACERAVAEALGRPIEIRTEVDPTLIAGLELEDRHACVRNSFKADLAKIAADIATT
jgi:F-type H+-transporting ATPase subunit b